MNESLWGARSRSRNLSATLKICRLIYSLEKKCFLISAGIFGFSDDKNWTRSRNVEWLAAATKMRAFNGCFCCRTTLNTLKVIFSLSIKCKAIALRSIYSKLFKCDLVSVGDGDREWQKVSSRCVLHSIGSGWVCKRSDGISCAHNFYDCKEQPDA